MEALTQFITPIVSLWVIHSAIFSSADFVNKMRETVISGYYEGKEITPSHRKAILWDWFLCIFATIIVCCFFFASIAFTGIRETLKTEALRAVVLLIGFYPLVCAGGFLLCSIFDFRLMVKAVLDADPKAAMRRFWRCLTWALRLNQAPLPVNSSVHSQVER